MPFNLQPTIIYTDHYSTKQKKILFISTKYSHLVQQGQYGIINARSQVGRISNTQLHLLLIKLSPLLDEVNGKGESVVTQRDRNGKERGEESEKMSETMCEPSKREREESRA